MIEFLKGEEVRGITMVQPYAYLMLPPYNRIETRKWKTDYRGWVLICSSKKPFKGRDVFRKSNLKTLNLVQTLHDAGKLINAHAIGIGRLVDCRKMEVGDAKRTYLRKRDPNLYCHIYEHVHPIVPVPILGTQKWKRLSQEFIDNLQLLSDEKTQHSTIPTT